MERITIDNVVDYDRKYFEEHPDEVMYEREPVPGEFSGEYPMISPHLIQVLVLWKEEYNMIVRIGINTASVRTRQNSFFKLSYKSDQEKEAEQTALNMINELKANQPELFGF